MGHIGETKKIGHTIVLETWRKQKYGAFEEEEKYETHGENKNKGHIGKTKHGTHDGFKNMGQAETESSDSGHTEKI